MKSEFYYSTEESSKLVSNQSNENAAISVYRLRLLEYAELRDENQSFSCWGDLQNILILPLLDNFFYKRRMMESPHKPPS